MFESLKYSGFTVGALQNLVWSVAAVTGLSVAVTVVAAAVEFVTFTEGVVCPCTAVNIVKHRANKVTETVFIFTRVSSIYNFRPSACDSIAVRSLFEPQWAQELMTTPEMFSWFIGRKA